MSADSNSLDSRIRAAAFLRIQIMTRERETLSSSDIAEGLIFGGKRIPLVNPQRGIFKPSEMRFLLSIRTVFPRSGRRVWYDDQRNAQQQIFSADDSVEYSFMGTNPDASDNVWLREAFENKIPIIYFFGVAPARYLALLPAFVTEWSANTLSARISFGAQEFESLLLPESKPERRYAMRVVQQRLHQSTFREVVFAAYGGRCALSGLPETRLLDAAHIVEDKHEQLGQPIVKNGLPLSKIHHAAFDAHLIGIDPDFGIHVSERLLNLHDGPMLDALKSLKGRRIHLPSRDNDRPDRERLAWRFERFRAVGSDSPVG